MEFEIETTINTTPDKIYKAWLDSDEHSAMTGSIAITTEDVGDKFTAWDGYIWGTTLDAQPHSYIKQSWRTTDFTEEQENSIVEIFLQPEGANATMIRIKHSGLTDNDGDYEQGWEDYYFAPMKHYFER